MKKIPVSHGRVMILKNSFEIFFLLAQIKGKKVFILHLSKTIFNICLIVKELGSSKYKILFIVEEQLKILFIVKELKIWDIELRYYLRKVG